MRNNLKKYDFNFIFIHESKQIILKLFGSYGTITGVKLIIDKATSKSLGYGFVKFSTGSIYSYLFSFVFSYLEINKLINL